MECTPSVLGGWGLRGAEMGRTERPTEYIRPRGPSKQVVEPLSLPPTCFAVVRDASPHAEEHERKVVQRMDTSADSSRKPTALAQALGRVISRNGPARELVSRGAASAGEVYTAFVRDPRLWRPAPQDLLSHKLTIITVTPLPSPTPSPVSPLLLIRPLPLLIRPRWTAQSGTPLCSIFPTLATFLPLSRSVQSRR
ncbi:hypothetical protein FKP32DRAFT_81478 [Trametes sanguinea]|nr:hypothetical protein FKP32DRAFT_81478 [Trametes sanguinea]